MKIDDRKDLFATNAASATPGTPKEVWLQNYYKQAKGAELYYEDTGTLNKTEYPIAEGDEVYFVVIKMTGYSFSDMVSLSVPLTYVSETLIAGDDVKTLTCRVSIADGKISVGTGVVVTMTTNPASISTTYATPYINQIWRVRV